jgi:ribulose-phosphate 3-epimerase
MALVSPSLRALDFARLGEGLESIRQAGARMVHVDVSDGHFAPEVSCGVPVIASIRRATDLVLDLHLLVERPERFIRDFIEAGAGRMAVHPEATSDLFGALRLIHSQGALAGVALRPAVPVEYLAGVLDALDFLIILAAEPGSADDDYVPQAVSKLRSAYEFRARRKGRFLLQVEGGVELKDLDALLHAGVDIVVAGRECFEPSGLQAGLKELVRRASGAGEEVAKAGSHLRES